MKKYRLVILLSLIISSLIFTACESDDDEKMLSAQNCFNGLDDSLVFPVVTGGAAAAAQVCIDKMGGINTEESNLLSCGITFWTGGLATQSIIGAFDAMDAAAPGQEEAVLIDNLALATPAIADTAYDYCYASGAAGMIYVAGIVKLGTYMEAAVGGDTTPALVVDECIANPTCNSAANGEMLIEMSEAYCVGESEEEDVCQAIAAAQAGTTDPATIMANFLAQINF